MCPVGGVASQIEHCRATEALPRPPRAPRSGPDDDRHQHAREHRAEDHREVQDGLVPRVRPRELGPRRRGEIREIPAAPSCPRVKRVAGEDEQEQRPEGQADPAMEERDERHRGPGGEIGDDAHALVAEAVNERAAEEAGEHLRHGDTEDGDARFRHAAGRRRTNHGKATSVICEPISEMALAA